MYLLNIEVSILEIQNYGIIQFSKYQIVGFGAKGNRAQMNQQLNMRT